MSKHNHIERPFLDQLGQLGFGVFHQDCGIIPSGSLGRRLSRFRDVIPLEVLGEEVFASKLPVNLGNQPRQRMLRKHNPAEVLA